MTKGIKGKRIIISIEDIIIAIRDSVSISNYNTRIPNIRKIWFSHKFVKTPEVPGSKEGIKKLLEYFDAREIFLWGIAIYSGENVRRMVQWLEYQGFFSELGILPQNVRFSANKLSKIAYINHLYPHVFVGKNIFVINKINAEKKFLFFTHNFDYDEYLQDNNPSYISIDNWHDLALEIILRA